VEVQGRLQGIQMTNESRERTAQMSARVTWQLGLLTHGINTKKSQLEEVDRILEQEVNEIKRGELRLQREALSHEITESNREVRRLMAEGAKPGEKQSGKPKPGGKPQDATEDGGPMKLQGDDKAGLLARGLFGDVPYAQG
jgi:hypothetical protein